MNENERSFRKLGRARLGRALLLLPIAAFLVSACGPDTDDTAEGNLDSEEPATVAGRGANAANEEMMAQTGDQLTIVQSPELGDYLKGPRGPVYLFTGDTKGRTSACYDACAEAWPPVTGELEVSGELDPSLIGSITRTDGTKQLTYGGWPLYRFTRDSRGGEPTGQGIESFGGEWYLLGPDGQKVEESTESSGTASDTESGATQPSPQTTGNDESTGG